ncbi:MAG: hotdog fold thioesterase [Bacteroidetes bacterium]|nr:MAG: hotdog fold thioesterase [Bacteroidota bacterium]
MKSPEEIVNILMMKNDAFSQWLGIQVLEIKKGYCKLQMQVRKEMLNGFYIAHGGISYSFADSALAFASNSHGYKAVSVETSISHTAQVKEGDIIRAETEEMHRSDKIAVYQVKVYSMPDKRTVALFKGTVYITSREW